MTRRESQEPTSNAPIQVLIVEDYKLTRVGLRSFFDEEQDIQVVGEAESGERAIELAKATKPQVVLMDLGLPGINGIEATEAIKNNCPQVKVVILTSHDREEEVYAALGAGANAYCLKDIDPARLTEVIKSVADGAAWLDPAVAMMALKLFSKPSSPLSTPSVSYLTLPTVNPRGTVEAQLTEREMEVLKLLVQGKSNTEIAKDLIVSVHTAKAHVCSILQKLYVNDRVQAAVKAVQTGLV